MAYELKHRLSNSQGNEHSPEEKAYLTCNEACNSTRYLTTYIFDRVISIYLTIQEVNRGAILLEDFKSHSTPEVKEHVKSFKVEQQKTSLRHA